MGHYKNTDNLGTTLQIGDRVGYIFGCAGHYRIHSGIVEKLCEKRVWIKPDEDFEDDVLYKQSKKELYKKSISKYDEFICTEYGKVVKL
jgi:hypothetical protein